MQELPHTTSSILNPVKASARGVTSTPGATCAPEAHKSLSEAASPAATSKGHDSGRMSSYEWQRYACIAENKALLETLAVPKVSKLFNMTNSQYDQRSENSQKALQLAKIGM